MRFQLSYTPGELAEAVSKVTVPPEFLWGVATAGYQAEGGFNGESDPKNNWYRWEGTKGRPVTGRASDFWNQYPEDLDRARWMGLNAFRMGLEWARIQPAVDPSVSAAKPPPFDEAALDAYARIVAAARERGLEPILTLLHFTTPFWAGLDFWLEPAKVQELFVPYVKRTVEGLNLRLVEKHGQAPVRCWVTLNEPFMLASGAYLFRMFPRAGSRAGLAAARTTFESILCGHALAYRAIHEIYATRNWARPMVTFNSWAARVYSIDKMAQDLMVAPSLGIRRDGVADFLADCRERFVARVSGTAQPRDLDGPRRRVDSLLDGYVWKQIRPETLPRLIDTVFATSPDPRLLDAVSFDFYDPYPSNYVQISGGFKIRQHPWDWTTNPSTFGDFLHAYSSPRHGLPLMVLENGFGFRGKTARGVERFDGARRFDGLRAHLFAALKALSEGVRLQAFCHWTITDNYEWGSFEPRFGLFAVDYENGSRRLPVDALGDNAGGAYRALVTALRSGEKDRILAAFRGEGLESYPG